MLRYFVVAAMSFGTLVFGSRCFAKDLEPVEPAKAQKVKLPIKYKTVIPRGAAPPAAEYKLIGPDGTSYNRLQPLEAGPLAAGQAGVLVTYDAIAKFKVISVVDGSNLIAGYDLTIGYGGGFRPDGTMSPIGEKHLHADFWLKGFSTKGIVDDDEVTVPWTIKVTGTKTYTAATGAKSTMLLIEPYQMTDKDRKAEQQEEARMQNERRESAKAARQAEAGAAAIEKAKWRIWTDASRTHTVEAQFKGTAGGQVKLLKKDGAKISIPLEGLSEEDQKWIRHRGKN